MTAFPNAVRLEIHCITELLFLRARAARNSNSQVGLIVLKNSVFTEKRRKTSSQSASWKFWPGGRPNQWFGDLCSSNSPLRATRANFSDATDIGRKMRVRILRVFQHNRLRAAVRCASLECLLCGTIQPFADAAIVNAKNPRICSTPVAALQLISQ